MAKPNAMLQKKVDAIESLLHELFTIPPHSDHRTLLADSITQRFLFLKRFLSAESKAPLLQKNDPSPLSRGRSHHLGHIARRVSELEEFFHTNRDEFWDPNDEEFNDTMSTCSCTDSCLDGQNEDEEGGRDNDSSPVGEKKGESSENCFEDAVMMMSDEGKEGFRRLGFWGVVVIGAVGVVIAGWCGGFRQYTMHHYLPTPT